MKYLEYFFNIVLITIYLKAAHMCELLLKIGY